jgi:phosphoglucomutase
MKADEIVLKRANQWLNSAIDEASKQSIKELMDVKDQSELIDSFYRDLEFGTGGLRGIMGMGSNRMNKYTIAMATQGLANYLKISFPAEPISVAISYDSRINSKLFAQTVANVFSSNGIRVYFSEEVRPTPMLSYAIRYYKCKSGVMLTASHNPKEYNGYKAYWEDGAQVVSPHDVNIIKEVQKITSIADVKMDGDPSLIEWIDEKMDAAYIAEVLALRQNPESISRQSGIGIVFSAMHGTTGKIIPKVLSLYGFSNVHVVPEQKEPDGTFPTVIFPNPEEAEALNLAIKQAEDRKAHLVLATDPDGDRVGAACLGPDGKFHLLNGNQTAAILTWYLLKNHKEKGLLKGNEFVVSTIVTSEILDKIAANFGVTCYKTLTGFKYIAAIVREKEGRERYIGGGEESYGYMIGDFVRDKDAVSACAILSEVAAWAKDKDMTLFDILNLIYLENGFYKEKLISLTKKGKEGAEEIQRMMQGFRDNMPESIQGIRVLKVIDVKAGTIKHLPSGKTEKLDLESSNVLQFYLEDGSKVSCRPSGTEPKIKFYISVQAPLVAISDLKEIEKRADKRIAELKSFLSS